MDTTKIVTESHSESLANQFLIAMPTLYGSDFSGSMMYLCQHTDEGAFGVVINRRSTISLGEVMHQMSIKDVNEEISELPILDGGPVEPERGFILHQPFGEWDSTLKMTDSISLTTSRDILEAIAARQGPKQFLIALGYAGWSPNQLEQEIVDNAWLNVPADASILFETPVEQRSKVAATNLGIDLNVLTAHAGRA